MKPQIPQQARDLAKAILVLALVFAAFTLFAIDQEGIPFILGGFCAIAAYITGKAWFCDDNAK